ncbi:MAG: IPT/TIG domain-containing protein [Polyangia bacterium]
MTLRAGFAVCTAALVGCAGNEPHPRIDSVAPAQAYTNRDLWLTLTGADFVPSFRIDPESGARVATMDGFSGRIGSDPTWRQLTNFGWIGLTQISAGLEKEQAEDLPIEFCDVEITDPRGHAAILRGGFDNLGPELAPVVTVASPTVGTICVPGGTFTAVVNAATPPPGHMTALTWTYTEPMASDGTQRDPVTGACPFLPDAASVDCVFDVTVSSNLNAGLTVKLEITAVDDAPSDNTTVRPFPIGLTSRPTVSSVQPQSGGMAGGTNVVILGSGFVAGSRAYFGTELLIPDGGIVVDQQTISGYVPARSTGAVFVPVLVQSRLGFATWDQKFEYQIPPQISSINPAFGPEGEDTQVRVLGTNFTRTTTIYLGHALANAVALTGAKFASDSEIDGVVPPGSGQVTVWALDPDNGWTSLPEPNGFSWNAP